MSIETATELLEQIEDSIRQGAGLDWRLTRHWLTTELNRR
jgi:hypothetical protein